MLCSKVCWHVCIISRIGDNWAATWDFCATSKGSDQPAHMRSLIRAFVSRLTILWLRYWQKLELSRLIWVCTCQNITLLEEIARRSSYVVVNFGLSQWPWHRMSENLSQEGGHLCELLSRSRQWKAEKFCTWDLWPLELTLTLKHKLWQRFFLVDGRMDPNTTKSKTPFKWRFACGPMMLQHWM